MKTTDNIIKIGQSEFTLIEMTPLQGAIKRAQQALRGDSNDEEHDALIELLDAVLPGASEKGQHQ